MNLDHKIIKICRSLGLGKLKYYGFHRPIGLLHQSFLEGGPIEQRRTERGRQEMIEAARRLPPLDIGEDTCGARVHFLSGRRFWHQTVFCFASMQIQAPFRITPIIFDDGSIDSEVQRSITRVIPWAEFVLETEIETRLDKELPHKYFPTLRTHRLVYPHLRKLTDIHIGAGNYRLVLDSDMLFFRNPTAILDWFRNPESLYIVDHATAYGYPVAVLEELAKAPLPDAANVGLYALDGVAIDWISVENWCRTLLENYGARYLLEQALTAMILAGNKSRALPPNDYIVLPDIEEGFSPQGVLHHYVAHSKRSYYQSGWRRIISDMPPQRLTTMSRS